MIGNVVSVLVTTVIQLFNYILTNVKVLAKEYMYRPADPPVDEWNIPRSKVDEWFKSRGISTQTLIDLQVSVRVLSICHKPARPRTR